MVRVRVNYKVIHEIRSFMRKVHKMIKSFNVIVKDHLAIAEAL